VVDILPMRRVSERTAGYHSPKMSSVGGPLLSITGTQQ